MLVVGAIPALGQAPTRVEEIRLDPAAHAGEMRTVEGVVDRLVRRATSESPGYYLEDDYGHQLLVIPTGDAPARGDRVTVTGVVSVDPSGDPILTVIESTAAATAEVAPAAVSPSPAGVPPPGGTNALNWLPWIGMGIALLLAAGLWMRARAAEGEPTLITGTPPKPRGEVDFATSALWPESEREFDGRTLRFLRPDPTVKMLPGKLEVMSGGDAGTEVRFVGVDDETSMMFGRAPGEGPSHVQLKQKTVSRTHAVIRRRHGEWLIENLSTTNPTVLNGETLGVKERLLTDGDRIEMGEVVFRFSER